MNSVAPNAEELLAENAELRAMLGREGKDSGRMWYDRAQRVKAERNEARAEAARERDARAKLSEHVAELERELREAKAELAATRRAGVTVARPKDWVRDD